MIVRPTGLIPDDVLPDDALASDLLGVQPRAFESAMLLDYFRFDLNQAPNQSCVAFAFASAIWAAQGIAGVLESERILISPDFLYHNTLRRMFGKRATLVDKGSRPRDAVATLNEIGVCNWDDWPHDAGDADKCLRDPPGNLQLAATDCDWVKVYRIDSAINRKAETMACLCAEVPWPVLCGLTLDQAYLDLKLDTWPGRKGEVVGRHMVALCGFDQVGPYVGTTWGPEWGDGGIGQITWEAFLSFETTDVIAVQVDLDKMPGR